MTMHGEHYFEPAEWKTAQQIKSFFSRYSGNLRQNKVGEVRVDGSEQILTEEDMEAWETETANQDLRDVVYFEINKPEHPIEAEQFNICQLSKEGKLKDLKIAQLRSICETLQLKIEGTQSRKKSFIHPLEEIVKNCSCHK